jgi:hypothetical protein
VFALAFGQIVRLLWVGYKAEAHSVMFSKPNAEGYAKIAQFMGTHDEFAIFRRFKELNIQNLLYMQAEITHLEAELREIASKNRQQWDRRNYAYDWWSLSQGESDEDTEQWVTVLEIREKLDKYSMWVFLVCSSTPKLMSRSRRRSPQTSYTLSTPKPIAS